MNINPSTQADFLLEALGNNRKIPKIDTSSADEAKLYEACRDFESMYVNMMLKEMRKTVPKEGFIPQSFEQNMFTSMFDEEVSKEVAHQGKLGLAEMLFKQLSAQKQHESNGEKDDGDKYLKLNRSI